MSRDKSLTSRVNAPALQRVHDAWAMRIRGAGWDEIARALGYANAPNAVRAVRNYVGRLPEPQAPELRSLWRERLEHLWPVAVRDVEAGKPGATRAAVAIAQRAAQLDGLDAPTRIEYTPTEREYAEIVAAMLAHEGITLPIEGEIIDVEPEPDE